MPAAASDCFAKLIRPLSLNHLGSIVFSYPRSAASHDASRCDRQSSPSGGRAPFGPDGLDLTETADSLAFRVASLCAAAACASSLCRSIARILGLAQQADS